jgi:hypothetical protein
MESMAGLLPARCDTAMLYQGNSNTWNKLQIKEREIDALFAKLHSLPSFL